MDLVIGATGILGRQICAQLKGQGRDVRALVRGTSDRGTVDGLKALGVDTVVADLKEAVSLSRAFDGVVNVISTASSTLSRGPGDTLESVDRDGNLNAISAAQKARVERFVFLSFPEPELTFPVHVAKAAVERAIEQSGLAYTILQPVYFLEVWFSPGLGFNLEQGKARTFAGGEGKLSWVSFLDVARVAAQSLELSGAKNRRFAFGGPEAFSQRDIIRMFEERRGRPFEIENVPLEALQQALKAEDQFESSFAAMMLLAGTTRRWQFDNAELLSTFDVNLTSARQFVERSLGLSA
jgi:uncharacterized protein YbjT (DUF2867 family)